MKSLQRMAMAAGLALWALSLFNPSLSGAEEPGAEAAALAGVNYVESHYDSGPRNSPVSWDDIDQDFQILASHFDIVRTYSLGLWNSLRTPRAAQRYGLQMAVGVGWAYNATIDNNNQLKLFKYIFGTYPELQDVVSYVIVGNEACIAGNQAAWDQWLQFYDDVNDWINANWKGTKPIVTMSERDGVWEAATTSQCGGYLRSKLPKGVPIFANIYPFWAGISVSDATGGGNAESLDKKWQRLTAAVSDRGIIIGETGWPTGGQPGSNPRTVTPSESDAATYWSYVYNTFLTNNSGVTLFAFSAFDEPLKPSEGGSPDLAHHWGMYDWQRGPKANMAFPKTVSVTPQPAVGAYVNIVVMAGGTYDAVKNKITISTPSKTYSYAQWYAASDGTAGYPWLEYNESVTVNLPQASHYPAVKCSNTLASGHGIGLPGDLNLQWSGPRNSSAPCSMITWANNGIWIP